MKLSARNVLPGKVVDLSANPGDFVEADVLLAKVEAA